MRLSSASALAAWLAAIAQAAEPPQFLVDKLSFGYTPRINDKGQQSVPQFSIQGVPGVPEVLSNKVILTQPAPGNARGAVWADNTNNYKEWIADVDFRVNGPERGGGNLNIWLARRGVQDIGSASIYTVEKFDGLALVVDRSGGGAGMIRGFLNDGTTDYKTHHSVDSLAFGHCDYSYRNLGRQSQIKMRQTKNLFKVEIDGRLCFESDKISIPPGYTFGITAASAENPDSFEVFKLVVMTADLNAQHEAAPPQQQQQQQKQQQDSQQQFFGGGGYDHEKNMPVPPVKDNAWDADLPDQPADSITSSVAQFTDLHNRLQSVNHHLSTIFRSVSAQSSIGEKRHEETSQAINDIKILLGRLDKLDTIMKQVNSMDGEVKKLRGELSQKIKDSENSIKSMMGDTHGTMLEHVAIQSSPKHGKLIFVIIASQVVLVAGYIYYERKKTLPKKYL
ncbi:concanavalin A-like lectin/glucanase domain-containing protein [Pseudomassariella vexata]|uniref:Concanavalin A-like lectin/glucanase domain-containing protein n=1 Tax=Pseudomassariella vexata TaxID=1141098 RepID=A0A1Y2EF69_9PEZI|nr:concanavalin A-like lectin/glucanase domain-containing protein [Pseudomassariella vexata]ORY70047.1 concanavalin A-like lectin/glucanase domain-containing protein [Pseudomassariella vexata]